MEFSLTLWLERNIIYRVSNGSLIVLVLGDVGFTVGLYIRGFLRGSQSLIGSLSYADSCLEDY